MKRQAVADAISAARVKRECSSCGAVSQWLLPSIAGTDDLEVMSMVAPRDASLGFNFAPLICIKCGATQLFHIETLMKSHGGEHDA